MDDSASLSVLANEPSGLSAAWQSFLNHKTNGLDPTVNPATASPGQRRDIDIDFNKDKTLGNLHGLKFSSANNGNSHFNVSTVDVPGSVLLTLPGGLIPSTQLGLGAVLDLLGLRPDGAGGGIQIPDNFGQLPTLGQLSQGQLQPPPDKKRSLVGWLIKKIDDAGKLLQVDNTEGSRNAIWLSPGQTLRTDVAVTFKPSDDLTQVLSDIQDELIGQFGLKFENSIKLQNLRLYIQRTCYGVQFIGANNTPDWHITTSYRMVFNFKLGNTFLLWIILEPTGMTLSVTLQSVGNLLELVGIDAASTMPDNTQFLQVIGGKDLSFNTWWRVTMIFIAGDGQFYLRYDSASKAFTGGLIQKGFYVDKSQKSLLSFKVGQDLENPSSEEPKQIWDVRDFMKDELKNLPNAFPTVVLFSEIAYDFQSKSLWFALKLVNIPRPPPPGQAGKKVPDPFTWDDLDMQIMKTPAAFNLTATTNFTLKALSQQSIENPSKPQETLTANLGLRVSYTKFDREVWLVSGYAQNLTGELLTGFFDPDYKTALVKVLGKLKIPELRMKYTYEEGAPDSPSPASSFAMKGIIQIGMLELRMFYQYSSSHLAGKSSAASIMASGSTDQPKPIDQPQPQPTGEATTDWRFECDLFASQPGQSVGSVIASISEGVAKILPSFVANISFPSADGGKDRNLITIKAEKDDENIYFVFRVVIGAFTLTYVQLSGKSADASLPPKRLFRFTCDKIPLLKSVPLLGELPQPFDQLEYLYMSGQKEADGLLPNEVDELNQFVLQGRDRLWYRKTLGQAADKPPETPSKTAIVPGHHFMVLNNGDAIIDHVFFPPEGSAQTLDQAASNTNDLVLLDISAQDDPAAPKESPPSKGALTFTIGPLTISGIALQFKQHGSDQYLEVTMDATFVLGPVSSPVITFQLLGFALGVPLSKVGFTLDKLSGLASSIRPDLAGLAFGFDKPPITIAGGFEHLTEGTVEIYRGGVTIGFPPYTFMGLGEYTILNNYKSVFLYAKLDGPLFSLGVATISGVRLGLGYNSVVRTPTIDEITQFPFINDKSVSGAGNNPMAILRQIMSPPSGTPWVSPKENSYWFAAGLTMEAFEIVSVTAVAMLAFRDSGLVISLFADAIAQMPPHVTNTAEMIIYVEIGLMAEMNFAEGYFMVAASVAPSSFLLVQACRLYGGFAMTYWFSPNQHAGDWVFSVGGYHPKYDPPAWYPRPKRLGISFVTYGISITGEAYFAISPKVIMGGALIRATLSVGPVRAWLETQFDALINLHPLHYNVSFSISVGIECNIDVWFVHIHITVSIGAQLQIFGPDFGGSAYVDFYLFAFTVDFGASPAAPPALNLLEFWKLVHRPGPNSKPVNDDKPDAIVSLLTFNGQPVPTEAKAAFKFALEDGSLPNAKKPDNSNSPDPESTGDGTPWFVKGGTFRFRVNSDFAFNHVVITGNDPEPSQINSDPATMDQIYSRPMHGATPIDSTLRITIRDREHPEIIIEGWQNPTFDIKKVPQASWGVYSTSTDPLSGGVDNKALLSNDNATTRLGMGVTLTAPKPYLADAAIPKFDATNYMYMRVLDFRFPPPPGQSGDNWYIPNIEPEQKSFLATPLTNEEQAMSNPQLYQDFEKKWSDLAQKQKVVRDPVDGLLEQISEILGWDKDRPQVAADNADGNAGAGGDVPTNDESPLVRPPDAASNAWKLKGDFPLRLLARFEDKYLELPRLAVPAAA